jgi:hypothetical protein
MYERLMLQEGYRQYFLARVHFKTRRAYTARLDAEAYCVIPAEVQSCSQFACRLDSNKQAVLDRPEQASSPPLLLTIAGLAEEFH